MVQFSGGMPAWGKFPSIYLFFGSYAAVMKGNWILLLSQARIKT